MKEIFRTDKYIIRTFSMDNFDDFVALNSDDYVSRYVNHDPNEKGKTFRECIEKFREIANTQEEFGVSYWAVYLLDNTFIGQCGLSIEYDGNFNLCYMYKKEYWGKGVGTEVATLVLNYMLKNFPNLFPARKIKAMSFIQNIASVRLLKRIGFEYKKSMTEFNKELQFFELNVDLFYERQSKTNK